MLVHRKAKTRYQIQMPLTSLIDIVFMLLIYFMLTANFIVDEGIDVKLPQAKQTSTQEEISEEITVYVDKDGGTYINDKLIQESELLPTLQKMIANQTDRLVIIKADRAVVLNSAVRVMDIAKAAGASKLYIATEKGDEN
ncbi:MAG: biopolymer transporter ExbD [Desulfamplus sp.]|nr:biopolymer transporter ExbD [Desulfamplus sp.]